MALPLFALVIVALLLNFGPIPSTASAQVRRHHHTSPASTATAHFHPIPSATPTMHQNYLETEESKSPLAVDPFADENRATSGKEVMAVMGATAHSAVLVSPQAAQPRPSLTTAPDLASQAPPKQPREEADGSAPATSAPRVNDPTSSTTALLPLPNQRTTMEAASPPPPSKAGAAGVVASEGEQGLQQLARVLTSLGYKEMASAALLLANSPLLARRPGAITVFAAPDVFIQASCSMCSRRQLLLEHIAMGFYPYSELVTTPSVKIPSASFGFCLKVASERGGFRIYVDGVALSHPELYNDGRYVVHGLHGILRPLSRSSCFHGSHHHLTAGSAATSAATAASMMRIMVREAIARLRGGGYGFVALAMSVKLAELENLANLTVFALDDQAIFVGGGHDYVSAVRFHIVPGHRLTSADLLRLQPGTILPTLAGDGQSLVVTHGASSSSYDVSINYIPIKEPDVAVNSRIAGHGVYALFPRLHLANLAASVVVASTIKMNGTCGAGQHFGDCASSGNSHKMNRARISLKMGIPRSRKHEPAQTVPRRDGPLPAAVLAAALVAVFTAAYGCRVRGRDGRRVYAAEAAAEGVYRARFGDRDISSELELQQQNNCKHCYINLFEWLASCCNSRYCSACLSTAYLQEHSPMHNPNPCLAHGSLEPRNAGLIDQDGMFVESEREVIAEFEQALQVIRPAPNVRVNKRIYASVDDVRARLAARRTCVYSRVDNEEVILRLVDI